MGEKLSAQLMRATQGMSTTYNWTAVRLMHEAARELDRLEAELASRPTPDGGGWQDERKEICAELGCIDDPGVPLRFVKGLRKDLRKAYARQDELIRSWDKATPTERQELDRLRRGWGPSTPTTHQKRWQDVKDCMTQIERVYDLCSPEDEDESPQQTLEKVSAALFEAIGFCSQRIQEICGHPGDKVDYSFTEGLTAMREMLASFVENGGDTPCKTLAQSMRLNWNPSWGDDPNRLPSPPKGELT